MFEAVEVARGLRVAVKLIPNKAAASAPATRISDEAGLAARVRHRHVVSVYDAGRYKAGDYLVMEFVDGPSVQSMVSRERLPWRQATAILIAACDAVMAAHARGIIHRDIKPSNLLRGTDGIVKLTDFGLACRLSSTMRATCAGTPSYMSPEQCRADVFDERTDIYSLGATYYTLLTGLTPYADACEWGGGREEIRFPRNPLNSLRVMFEHCVAPAPDPRRIRPGLSSACVDIVKQAMAKRRSDRFSSARELRRALLQALHGRLQAWMI